MKKALILVLLLSGCANRDAYRSYLEQQQDLNIKYYETIRDVPLVAITLPGPAGQEYKIVVNQPVERASIEQIKDSEWTRPAEIALKGATLVGGLYAGADIVGALLNSAGAVNTANGDIITISGDGTGGTTRSTSTEVTHEYQDDD